jgi:hypothetical protein
LQYRLHYQNQSTAEFSPAISPPRYATFLYKGRSMCDYFAVKVDAVDEAGVRVFSDEEAAGAFFVGGEKCWHVVNDLFESERNI